MTFDPHPREVLRPDERHLVLTPMGARLNLLGNLGVKWVVVLPFTQEFAMMCAGDFLEACLDSRGVEITAVVVGEDWRFGRGGEGDVGTIEAYALVHGFELCAVKELELDGARVSSSAIRRAVSGGMLKEAAKMLGRNYSVSGEVIHGASKGGMVLGFRTANLRISHGVIPPRGVYAGYARHGGHSYRAAISVGVSPTFSGIGRMEYDIEIHLLDFEGDIYGKELEVEFVGYIREERCYADVEMLRCQVGEDIAVVRRML
ncbi:MAG: bifunctional riboflavin kinase/FMN adenylyltransferase, partial [Victivallales bacterium]|nr:bifunctional riboflavin kinase/FMN adenylyltransferase [Victivallales bacterium]